MDSISIIILNFNGREYLRECLRSIFIQNLQNIEIIIVDNNLEEKMAKEIKRVCPQIILIENRINKGPCYARNQGIRVSKGSWILTLDCDTVLDESFLPRIIEIINRISAKVGIIQPRILRPDKRTIYSCGIHLSWLRRFYDIGRDKQDNAQFNESQYVFGACSACCLYRRRMLEDIKEESGYFDERFFFLVEDVDISWRARRKGWKTLYVPEAICYHQGNSSNTDFKLRQYLCFRNRYYTIIKNEGLLNYGKRLFPLFIYDFPRILYLLFANPHVLKGIREIVNFLKVHP